MPPTNETQGDDSLFVENDVFLLRRFPNEPDKYDFSLQIPRLNIFLPSMMDVDGLSLNREGELFLSAAQLLALANSDSVRKNGGVVAVLCESVRGHQMTVDPSPAESPGHVVIPEINRIDYDKKEADGSQPGKRRIKVLADLLARMAQVRIHPKPKNMRADGG